MFVVSFTVLAKTASMNPKNFNNELLRPGILLYRVIK